MPQEPSRTRLFVNHNGKEIGPLEFREVMTRLRAGELELNDLCREESAREFAPLRLILPKIGPPLPPSASRPQSSSSAVTSKPSSSAGSTTPAKREVPKTVEERVTPADQTRIERVDEASSRSPEAQAPSSEAKEQHDETFSDSLGDKVIIKIPTSATQSAQPPRKSAFAIWGWAAAGVLGFILLAVILTSSPKSTPRTTPSTPNPPLVSGTPRPGSSPMISLAPLPQRAISVATHPESADKERPFENSLGMRFAPIPETGVLLSIWDTKVQDYQVFTSETGRTLPQPGFPQDHMDPVVNVTWDDAKAFCDWLTEREHRGRRLPANQRYRLPTNMEWNCAVGLDCQTDPRRYPWGDAWPPPKNSGNYAPQLGVDSYEYTSPVGNFAPNKHGFYDLSGNVLQWCDDWADAAKISHVQRGSSWGSADQATIRLDARSSGVPTERSSIVGFRCVITAGTRNGRTWQTWIGEFVKNFVADHQLQDVDANLAYYGNLVNYFDSSEKDQSYIRSDIEKNNQRWPIRHESIEGGNIGLGEKLADKEYIARFKLNYNKENSSQKVSTNGQYDMSLDIMTFDGVPKIVGIKATVLRQDGKAAQTQEDAEVRQVFEKWFTYSNAGTPEEEASLYSDPVDYLEFGNLTRAQLLEELKKDRERWPWQKYATFGKAPIIEKMSDSEWRVNFEINFDARNPSQLKGVTGTAHLTWIVQRRAGGGVEITSSKEQVINRMYHDVKRNR
jgi:Sulfatase-modifying factor enzyme 1